MSHASEDEHLQVLTTTAELRIPSQERGTRRVESILDAAAVLVVEVGVEGLTVQLLAERARTSKGSLYHFFPDVPSVLRALADRHFMKLKGIMSALASDASLDWATMGEQELVRHMLAPLGYLEQHSDLLALVRAPAVLPRSSRTMQPMLEFVGFILNARFPAMPAQRREARAATIVAVIDGAVGSSARGCYFSGAAVRHEMEELLAIYLRAL